VAIVNNQTPLGCGGSTRCSSAAIVDLAGYGQGSDYETAAALSPSGVNGALFRAGNGCLDSDDNSADFTGGNAVPRDASTPFYSCDVDLAGVDMTGLPDLAPEPDLVGSDLAGARPTVVISQLYGSGGDSGAAWRNDFVELFNRGALDVDVGGWSLQYASKDNTFALKVDIPTGTVMPAGGYFLVRLSSGGGSGATVPDPDLMVVSPAVLNISAASGKLALVDSGTLQVCGTAGNRCASPAVVDLVGYGAAADYEGAPSASFAGAGDGLFRKLDGCQDTDHNDQDFFSAAVGPRNSGTPVRLCSAAPADAATPAPADAATAADAAVSDAGPADAAVPGDLAVHVPAGDLGMPDLALPWDRQGRASAGCGCEVGGAGEGGWWILLLLFYAVRAIASTRPRSERSSEMSNPG
jgi:MYXO-CTERM domain-containing protein